MRKIFLSSLLICLLSASFAQNAENRWSIGVFGGKTEYNGDWGNAFLKFNKAFYPIGAISINRYITGSFDLGIFASYGEYGYKKDNTHSFFGTKSDASLLLTYKLANGYIFNENVRLAPFISAGFGFTHLSGNRIWNGRDYIVPVGGGIKFNISKHVALQYQLLYHFTDQDKRDGRANNHNEQFASHALGMVFSIGSNKNKDNDNDGVINKLDLCPDVPGVINLSGCPDSDNDGIMDYEDQCPNVKGLAQFQGCPDTDGDGIKDAEDKCPTLKGLPQFQGCPDSDEDGIQDTEDKCPTVKGIAKFKGCPDTDDDGIQDSEDKCPTIKGLPQYQGCPDTDGDGIPDPKDRCPTIPGTVALNGCPDKDGDGIPDIDDKCPNQAGTAANKGCPEISAAEKLLFDKALRGIQFETGRSTILTASYPIIDEIVRMLSNNNAYNLEINGHTDNTGNAEHNLKLSQDRAEAVKRYITSKGISPDRITTSGFGDTEPVSSNYTAKGRALNRRVEFKVTF